MPAKRVCVIIPTYNNEKTLLHVIDSVLEYSHHVIVVNDGSTDSTAALLQQRAEQICILTHPRNRGMGAAMVTGFRAARQMGYDYAITLDSDGQHYASDIPLFVEAIKRRPNAIIIGNRFDTSLFTEDVSANMKARSKFANKFSNFWFRVQTGIKLEDTQTGFRAYPLNKLYWLNCITPRYEAQLEFIVFAAWHNVKIESIPVHVYYPPPSEHITHFRPAKDFLRISLLNTLLTMVACLYAWPYKLVKFILSLLVVLGLFIVMFFIQSWLLIYFNWRKLSEKERLGWHNVMRVVTSWLINNIPRVHVNFLNPTAETFEHPAIVVVNHESMLDLLCIISLSPKLIALTKRRGVWFNPLYGIGIRYAEYLPVRDNFAHCEDKLAELVARGYSIVIFPEGTRSENREVLRFKQGAFYLAQKHGIDILPIFLQGTGEVLGRHKKLVSSGNITVEIKPRVAVAKGELGESPLAMARAMRAQYKRWKKEAEIELEL